MKTLARSMFAASLALIWGATHAESAPTPPVEIRDSADPWALAVNLDHERYVALYASQAPVQSSNAPALEELSIDSAALRADGRAMVRLSLDRRALEQAADGVYVQRVSIDAVPATPDDAVYRAQRVLYFRVSGGTIERIGMREYSLVADPVHYEHDASGREVAVHAGTAVLHPQDRAAEPARKAVQLPDERDGQLSFAPIPRTGERP